MPVKYKIVLMKLTTEWCSGGMDQWVNHLPDDYPDGSV